MSVSMPFIALKSNITLPLIVSTFDVGRAKSRNAIQAANSGDKIVFISLQLDEDEEEFSPETVHKIGCIAKIMDVSTISGSSIRVTVSGLKRAELVDYYYSGSDFYLVDVEEKPFPSDDEEMDEAYFRQVKNSLAKVASVSPKLGGDTFRELNAIRRHDYFVYRLLHKLDLPADRAQAVYGAKSMREALSMADDELYSEISISQLEKKIAASVKKSMDKNQRDYYLHEQLKAIHKELGDEEDTDLEKLEEEIKAKNMPAEVEEKVIKEAHRMNRMTSSSADFNVLRGYIDWMLDLPWGVYTEDTEKLSDAVEILNNDHYGLEKIKERITEYLAVLKLTGGLNAPILCLVGPPGVGKTSVASSVARALGRKFVRMSLGGVRDEAEIRGHRKTYVGAMPGRIINGIKNAGSMNPVFLLDEIDKLSCDIQGDPSSALLEVLDPAQNCTFRDRYLEVPFDLSKVLFITTANTLDTIPGPLRDRMEILQLEGYTQEEKSEICKRYLVPKCVKRNGLEESDVEFTDEGIGTIISGFTLEAGVRGLEREVDAVCRKVAVKKADDAEGFVTQKIEEGNVDTYLGKRKYDRDSYITEDEVGAATGLAWTSVGGTTLTIEVSTMAGKGNVMLTGKLGDVMQESAKAAISFIRSRSDDYGIDSSVFETTDIHVHVPEGATPKDGPSAGITMATAILSAFTKKPVRHDVAMTGEITLMGRVLPIGGLKEKAMAAYRIGIKDVIIPEENKKDLEEMPESIKDNVNFIPVSSADTVFRNAIIGL
ncbi:MAG: endopeptidase La [Clostridia bacterium]|nr:endopeptidase La [Clostridia bacterium]